MVESTLRIPRLSEPPRDIPSGLRLKILSPYDVTGTLMYTVPASLLLVGAAVAEEMPARITFAVIGAVLLILALQSAVPAVLAARATLGRMRNGFLTVGRIVSCRAVWDKPRADMPYAQYLDDWVVNVGRSQMAKATGCLTTLAVWIFFVPFMLAVIVALVAVILASLNVPGGAGMAGNVDTDYAVRFAVAAIATVVVGLGILKLFRRGELDQVRGYMEWRKLAHPGPDDFYDDHARQLVEEAKARGVQISLKSPLPEDSASAMQILCKVEYSVMNQPCVASGRARLTNRLDPSGVEVLLFDPGRRDQVDLLVGLPAEVEVGPLGQWKDIPWPRSAVVAAISAAVGAFALLTLAVAIQSIRIAAGH